MDFDWLMKIAPLLAGAALLIAFIMSLFRDPKISMSGLLIVLLAALLIMVPILTNFTLKGSGFELSANIRGEIGEQGAELKRQIADLKAELDKVRAGSPVSSVNPAEPTTRSRAPSVLIFYTLDQKPLAVKIEDYLLHNGYAANAIFTDFNEVDMKETPGTVRFAFTASNEGLAKSLKSSLQSQFPEIAKVTDRYREKLGSGDVQIQMF